MAKVTYLKEIDGALWARLELDMSNADAPVHVMTNTELEEIKKLTRQEVWDEIHRATCAGDYD